MRAVSLVFVIYIFTHKNSQKVKRSIKIVIRFLGLRSVDLFPSTICTVVTQFNSHSMYDENFHHPEILHFVFAKKIKILRHCIKTEWKSDIAQIGVWPTGSCLSRKTFVLALQLIEVNGVRLVILHLKLALWMPIAYILTCAYAWVCVCVCVSFVRIWMPSKC